MTPRMVAGLCVAGIIATAGAVWQYQMNSSGFTEIERGQRVLPDLLGQANNVMALNVQQGDRIIRIERKGDTYVLGGSGYPVKGGKFQTALVAAASLEKFDAKTQRDDKYPLIEVEEPATSTAKSRLLSFEDASGGTLASIIIGKKARGRIGGAVGDGQYVRLPGDKQSWLVRGLVEADVALGVWVDDAITDMNIDHVALAAFKPADGPEVVVRRTGVSEGGQAKFEIDNVPDGRKPKNELTVRYAATDIGNVSFIDVRKDEGGDVAWRTRLIMADGMLAEFNITRDDWISLKVLETGKDKSTATDLQSRTQGWQYKVADYKLKQLKLTMDDLTE
ncbi:MAG: hypothetical protein WBD37_11075 [Anderseniella sp.]